jgi:hypothetical protein
MGLIMPCGIGYLFVVDQVCMHMYVCVCVCVCACVIAAIVNPNNSHSRINIIGSNV